MMIPRKEMHARELISLNHFNDARSDLLEDLQDAVLHKKFDDALILSVRINEIDIWIDTCEGILDENEHEEGFSNMNLQLNRQARLNGNDCWESFGNVTLEDAAVKLAEKLNRTADRITVQIRDEAEPDQVWTVTVESCRAYKVHGLRGGDC